MSEGKRGPGRPRNPEVPYDAEVIKEFVKRFFAIQHEIGVLREDTKELKEEFKDKINQKLLNKIIRLVKIKVALEDENASPETIEEIEALVLDKVNQVI